MMSALLAALTIALSNIGMRLIGAAFLEKILAHLIVAGGEKLAQSTTNEIDDKLIADIKAALKVEGEP